MYLRRKNLILSAVLLFAVLFFVTGQVINAAPLSERLTTYTIHASLDVNNMTVTGHETVIWRNPGEKTVNDICFHLYMNAFRDPNTTFMKESGGQLRGDRFSADGYGWIDVNSLKAQGSDLTGKMRFVASDDGNPDDKTVMAVTLPKGVKPGEAVTLDIVFTVKLPKVFARAGYSKDFVMVAQWFPKIAVYETKGMRQRAEEGWNAHQYHGSSEFYADFGTYDVTIQVPVEWVVAACGEEVDRSLDTETATYRFVAEDVHDFAWTASPYYQVFTREYQSEHVPGLTIKLYLYPQRVKEKERYFNAVIAALEYTGKRFGPYPYKTLSVINTAPDASGASGMEYPTLITADHAAGRAGGFLETVTVHEFAHQYWYGMVASNEFEEAWLDEGFTTYTEHKIMEQLGKKEVISLLAANSTETRPLTLNAWEYDNDWVYASNVYNRGALILHQIEALVGQETMDQIWQTYFDRWKFKHPSTRDFQAVVEEVTGQDWDPFFADYVYNGGKVDFAVADLQNVKLGKGRYASTVTVANKGTGRFPLTVKISFADGSSRNVEWNGLQKEKKWNFTGSSPVTSVRIDPEGKMLMDADRQNNFLQAVNTGKRLTMSAILAAWVQLFLRLMLGL